MNPLKCATVEQPAVIDSSSPNSSLKVGMALNNCLQSFDQSYSEIIFLCIGSDRATGDSLGPLIGHKLVDILDGYDNIKIYGTLENTVHATNLSNKIDMIDKYHENPLIIAIDACLGDSSNIGYITVMKGYANPGSGVGKNLPSVGDITISGVVNCSSSFELLTLQNTSLNVIMKMADIISVGIYYGLKLFYSAILEPV